MANRLYNKQVTPKGYMKGGRVKKMGGGMMKRKTMMKGSKPDFLDLDKDNNKTESMKSAAASAKKMKMGGRVKKMGGGSMMMMKKRTGMKKGSIPPQLRKFVMAKKKKAKICAGKIKDPSGLKRKDFRGKKAKGGLMEATARLKRQGLKNGGRIQIKGFGAARR